MSVVKSGSSLRTLLLTPDRIPAFLIPSRSPRLILSPHRSSPDRVRLLSDHDEDSAGASPPEVPLRHAASPRFLLRLPPRGRIPRRSAAAAADPADMSLPHVENVTTPYGFRGVLAESPRTHRRESLFHREQAGHRDGHRDGHRLRAAPRRRSRSRSRQVPGVCSGPLNHSVCR